MLLSIIIFINFLSVWKQNLIYTVKRCILKTQANLDTVRKTQLIPLLKKGKEFKQFELIVKQQITI